MLVAAAGLSRLLQADLPRVSLIFGDEPLLVEETCDSFRRRARQLGYEERQVMTVETGFDWGSLLEAAISMSLFSARRLIDLRLPSGRPGDAGAKALTQYCDAPHADTALMVICGRLDGRTKQTKWYKTLERAGIAVEHKAVPAAQLPAWIRSRVKSKDLDIEQDACTLLASYTEGNLLAAAQEIEKLGLLYPEEKVIRCIQVTESITDNARFDIFTLVDDCVAGNAGKVLRSLNGLRQEGAEPVLIVWALAKQVRTLYRLSTALAAGQAKAGLFKAFRIWPKHVPAINAALKRYDRHDWARLLRCIGRLDRVLKGRESGNLWQNLEQVCLSVAGLGIISGEESQKCYTLTRKST